MKIKKIVACLLGIMMVVTMLTPVAAADVPTVLSRNEWVQSGETALISGDSLNTVTDVKISRIPDSVDVNGEISFVRQPRPTEYYNSSESRAVAAQLGADAVSATILQKDDVSLMVQIPEMEFGIYAARVYVDAAGYETFYFNSPSAEWILGDMGANKATSGSKIRIQGKNLMFEGKEPVVKLENTADGTVTTLSVTQKLDKYSLEAQLPEGMSNGTYRVFVHNGYGDNTCWSEPAVLDVVDGLNWPAEVFNVRDYGAVGDMATDDTAAFRLAMAAAADNGGGVVYVPRGTYVLSNGFTLPENTEFRGDGNMLTQIIFDTSQYDNGEVPETMIYATDNFAIRDMYIWGTRLKTLVQNYERDSYAYKDYENIFIDNLVVRSHAWMGKVDINNHRYDAMREVTPEGDGFDVAYLFMLMGNNVQFCNNDIFTYSAFGYISGGSGIRISDNKLESSGGGLSVAAQGLQNVITENNTIQDGQISYGAWNIRLVNENIYHARNVQNRNFGNDREAMTMDGQKHAFNGTGVIVEGTKVIFPKALSYGEIEGMRAFIGAMVNITSGKGVGQSRTLVAYDEATNTGTISSPFKIDPDAESSVQLISKYNNFVITENQYKEANCLSTYAQGYNWIIDGNSFERTFGISLKAYSVYTAAGNVAHYDIMNNHFVGGPDYIHWTGVMEKDYLSGDYAMTLLANNHIQFTNIRNNTIENCGTITLQTNYAQSRIEDMVIQNNTFNNTDRGMVFNAYAQDTLGGIVLKGNHYNNVGEPYTFTNTQFGDRILNLD